LKKNLNLKNLCPATLEYVEKKLLSPSKIQMLARIKQFIDGKSNLNYLNEIQVQELTKKYHARPSVITWGDYFQSELAEDHHLKSDAEFEKIVQTVQFDIIASILIFQGKNENFLSHVDEQYRNVVRKSNNEPLSKEDQEAVHLGILKSYYLSMGLSDKNLDREDYDWFYQFSLQKAN
jgi:hypothetical protein